LKEAALSYQNPRCTATEADEAEQEAFHEEIKKRLKIYTTVVWIDQIKKAVHVNPRAAWFPRGTRPSVEFSGQRDWTCLLSSISERGDHFFARFEECVTTAYAKHIILILYKEYDYVLATVLDCATYFQVSGVTGHQVRDDLVFVT